MAVLDSRCVGIEKVRRRFRFCVCLLLPCNAAPRMQSAAREHVLADITNMMC